MRDRYINDSAGRYSNGVDLVRLDSTKWPNAVLVRAYRTTCPASAGMYQKDSYGSSETFQTQACLYLSPTLGFVLQYMVKSELARRWHHSSKSHPWYIRPKTSKIGKYSQTSTCGIYFCLDRIDHWLSTHLCSYQSTSCLIYFLSISFFLSSFVVICTYVHFKNWLRYT